MDRPENTRSVYAPVVIDLVGEVLVVRCAACGDERTASLDAAGVANARAMIGRHAHCPGAARPVPAA